MKHIRLVASGSGRRRSGKMINHKQHQANKLRKQAAKADGQILRLLKHKKRLLELAAKLEAGCYEPDITELVDKEESVKFGFARE